jgi:hypothetical protein
MKTVHIIFQSDCDVFDKESLNVKISHIFENPLDARSELVAHGFPDKEGVVRVQDGTVLNSWWIETHEVL